MCAVDIVYILIILFTFRLIEWILKKKKLVREKNQNKIKGRKNQKIQFYSSSSTIIIITTRI